MMRGTLCTFLPWCASGHSNCEGIPMALFQRRDQLVEMRKSPRHEVHYPAHIEISGSPTPLSCVICDISALGAKLTIRDVEHFPDEFTLLFRRRCRVVHRFDGQIGVQFVAGG